jgi:hypothetical protein
MKKILLCVPLLAIFAAGFFGCSQQRQWNHEQRKAMREALRSYRQMVYLDDLNDAEFVLFSDEVAGQLENSYPVYMEFVQMQGVDETVDMVVVSTIVDELNAEVRDGQRLLRARDPRRGGHGFGVVVRTACLRSFVHVSQHTA